MNEIGNFASKDLLWKECTTSDNGTANIVVNIEEILNIYFKGTGSIKYIDNPEVKKDVSNLFDVKKINW